MFCKSQLLQESQTARLEDEKLRECLNALTEKTRIESSIYESTDVSKIDYSMYMLAEDPQLMVDTKFVVYYLEETSFYLPGELPISSKGRLTFRP